MSQPVIAPQGRPGLTQRGKAKTFQRAVDLINRTLGPSEQILAGVRVEAGISRWWMLLSSWASFLRKYYFLTLTEGHVVLCRTSRWTGRPSSVEAYPAREQVMIAEYRPGVVYGSFRFSYPGAAKPVKMRVHRVYRPEMEFVMSQLGVPVGQSS